MIRLLVFITLVYTMGCGPASPTDLSLPPGAEEGPLPSWKQGAVKNAFLQFVKQATNPDSGNYVPPAGRVAIFDHDGTLRVEQPMDAPLLFALEQVRQLAPEHPEWRVRQPFRAVLENDKKTIVEFGRKDLEAILTAARNGMPLPEFREKANTWLDTARHPKFGRTFRTCVFQPLVEAIEYLQAHEFRVVILCRSGVEVVRAYSEEAFGVPPGDVFRAPDNKGEEASAFIRHLGAQTIVTFASSDSSLPLMQHIAAGQGLHLIMYIHHDDPMREYAYDRESPVGRLDQGLEVAKKEGWPVVSMKNDWKRVFPDL